MNKRYQVFVSSTYADLQEERRKVIQTLMEMDCIPSGMELFPAADEEQFEFIKKVIDDCDYYLLIIGGRYGSTTAEGISYTEKEFDYAIEKGMQVLVFIHGKPDEIPAGKSEMNPEARGRLNSFREKASKNRLVRFWEKAEDLPGMVALSLSKTMKSHPAVGWIRADEVTNTQLLTEINELRKSKEELLARVAELSNSQSIKIPDIADLDEKIRVNGTYQQIGKIMWTPWHEDISWREIFRRLAPELDDCPNSTLVKIRLEKLLIRDTVSSIQNWNLSDDSFQTIKIQLQALGLISVDYRPTVKGGMALFWSLTKEGKSLLYSLRVIRSNSAPINS
jgi:hypothetical protein